MPLPEVIKRPLRRVKRDLHKALTAPTTYCTRYNDSDADVMTGGEAFFLRLSAHGWTRCFDVGANMGDYARTLLSVNPSCSVTCFEPNPDLRERLQGMLASANPGCTLVSAAVGDVEGRIVLNLDPDCSAHSSAYRTTPRTRPLTVPQVTLDAHCERHGVTHVDCVKIDTEGHEYAVMQGMAGLMKRDAVGVIQFEFGVNSRQAGVTFRCLYDLLEPKYRLCHILPGGLLPVSYDAGLECLGFSNWAAFSRSRYG